MFFKKEKKNYAKRLMPLLKNTDVTENASMAEHTTLRCGGKAMLLCEAGCAEDISAIRAFCDKEGLSCLVMGNGSNLLFKDGLYQGAGIKLSEKLSRIEVLSAPCDDEVIIRAEAGALLSVLAKKACSLGCFGLEFAVGIPGSVGGAVFMNAGAYGGEISDVITEAVLLAGTGEEKRVSREDLALSYRHSAMMETGDCVLSAEFTLKKGDSESIDALVKELTRKRTEKQPLSYPSAGSFFKRPEGYFAGKLIEDAGLKGLSVGGAMVSELHAGFIINTGNASASDVINLMTIVRETVLSKFGVLLEPEVRIIGN